MRAFVALGEAAGLCGARAASLEILYYVVRVHTTIPARTAGR